MGPSQLRWVVALSWLALLLTGALAASSEVEMLEEEAKPAIGSRSDIGAQQLERLRSAVAAAKKLVARAHASGKSADVAIAHAAMKGVKFLTIRLEQTIGETQNAGPPAEPKPSVDPMAQVRVDSDKQLTEFTYPALGYTTDVGKASPLDGEEPAPVDNAAAAWGSDVSKEDDSELKTLSKNGEEVWSQFGDLQKILEPGYGHGFGKVHTRDKASREGLELKRYAMGDFTNALSDAKGLLAESARTLPIVTKAVDTIVKLDSEDASSIRKMKRSLKTPADPAKTAAWGGPEDEQVWDKIQKENNDFKKEDGLLEYSTSERAQELEARKDEEHQAEVDAEAEAKQTASQNNEDAIESAEQKLENISAMTKENEQLQQMDEKRVNADTAQKTKQQDAEDQIKMDEATQRVQARQAAKGEAQKAQRTSEEKTPDTELAKEQEKNMSLEEKTASEQAPNNVQKEVNSMTQKEQAKQESAQEAEAEAEKASEEVAEMASAQKTEQADTEKPSDEPDADAEADAEAAAPPGKGGKGSDSMNLVGLLGAPSP